VTQTTDYYPTDVDELELGGDDAFGAPFLKIGPATRKRPAHTAPGQWKGGRIVRIRKVQATKLGKYDPVTEKYERIPQFYKKGPKAGQPIEDFRLTLQTDERDPAIDGDDGLRTYDLSGFDQYWLSSVPFDCGKRAARLAVERAGAKTLQVGGDFFIAWRRQVDLPGIENPATDLVAHYVPPGNSVNLAAEAAEAAPVQSVQQPVPTQQAAVNPIVPPGQVAPQMAEAMQVQGVPPVPTTAPAAPPAQPAPAAPPVAQPAGFPPPPQIPAQPAAPAAGLPAWAQQ
jgi:hypothetical protein